MSIAFTQFHTMDRRSDHHHTLYKVSLINYFFGFTINNLLISDDDLPPKYDDVVKPIQIPVANSSVV